MLIVRFFFSILILGPIIMGVYNFRKNRRLSAVEKRAYYTTLVNSAVLYAIAYNVIFFLQELFLVLGKKAIGLTAYLYHNNHGWEGEHPMASLMQGTGALGIFIIGLVCLVWFRVVRNSKGWGKMLVLWLAFQGLIQSMPQVMVAFFDANTDVGNALVGYLELNRMLLIVLAIVSIIATALASMWFARPLLEAAPADVDLDHPKARLMYMRYIGAGAALLGCILIIPFRIPPMHQIISPFLLFVFAIPWTWAIAAHVKQIRPVPNAINEKIHPVPVVVLVVLLLIFQFVLAPGIAF